MPFCVSLCVPSGYQDAGRGCDPICILMDALPHPGCGQFLSLQTLPRKLVPAILQNLYLFK